MESEDEDRKFFRAAAEAIVATSMNNPIDPTILELLRRIQYASLSKNQQTQNHNTESFLHQQLVQGQTPAPQTQSTLGLIDSTKTANFPTFNLNYFGLGNGNNTNNSTNNNGNGSSSSQHNASSPNVQMSHQTDSWKQQTSNTRSALKSDSIHDPGPRHSPLPVETQKHTPNSHPDHTSATNTPSNPFSASNPQSIGSPDDGEPKPYACRDCTLSFRRSSDLRRHQRAHLPVLPHVCQRCGKGFARKDALKRHTDTLTCKRNRERMLSSGGDLEGILARANEIKRQRLDDMDEDDEDGYNGKDEEDY